MPYSIAIPTKKTQIWPLTTELRTLLVFFMFLFLFSRGIVQSFLPKSIAMGLQVFGTTALLTLILWPKDGLFQNRNFPLSLFSILFLLEAMVSYLITSYLQDFHLGFVYIIFNLLLLWIAQLIHGSKNPPSMSYPLPKILVFWGWLLFSVALLEQLKLITMPGRSFVFVLIRPASLTGSFLHYPILIAPLGFVALECYRKYESLFYLLSSCAFLLAPFLAVSRSGVLIVAFAFTLYFLYILKRHLLKGVLLGMLILSAILGVITIQGEESIPAQVIERLAKSANPEAKGNSGRIDTWKKLGGEYLNSNFFFGEKTGEITNSTGAYSKSTSVVAESSLLQLLANFGLLGTLFFYGILFYTYSKLSKEHLFLRICYCGCLIQTLVYQSVEVMAFISLLLMFPWISNSLLQVDEKDQKLQNI